MISSRVEKEHIADLITKQGFTKAVIEAGHYYVDHSKSPDGQNDRNHAEAGILHAIELGGHLRIDKEYWLFVDDLHQDEDCERKKKTTVDSLDPFLYECYVSNGYSPRIVYESAEDLNNEALDIVHHLIRLNETIEKERKFIEKWRKGVTFIDDQSIRHGLCQRERGVLINPTCSTIDAAVYLRKFQAGGENGVAVTLLSDKNDVFPKQQAVTRRILEHAGYNIPIINLYFNHQGLSGFETNFR